MNLQENNNRPPQWIKTGLVWGVFMFLIMSVAIPLLFKEEITWKRLLLGVVVWTIAGLLYGYIMMLIQRKRGK